MPMLSPQGDDESRTQAGGAIGAGLQWCALCGSEYLAGVAACADCLVPLVDNPPLPSSEVGDEEGEQIAYEYDDLDAEARFAIDRVLASAGIVHAWEDTTLVVAPYDEDEVDRLLDAAADEVEGGGGDVDEALLDDDAEQVIYDLEDWDSDRRTELDGRLEAEGIAHAFDETGDLVVLATDEERVDTIVDEIEFPDQLPADDAGADGLDAVETVGNLFVATDRLVHDPGDPEGTLAAVDATRAMATMSTPFGFSPPVWTELVAKAEELRKLLETEAEIVDDDAVHEAATGLRTALRPYV
jgi:hypothetical protein